MGTGEPPAVPGDGIREAATAARPAERAPATTAAIGVRAFPAAREGPAVDVRAPKAGPGVWTIGTLPTDEPRVEPRIATVETLGVPLAVSAAATEQNARSAWRDPPRRRWPLFALVLVMALAAAAVALEHYGYLPPLRLPGALTAVAPPPAAEPVPDAPPAAPAADVSPANPSVPTPDTPAVAPPATSEPAPLPAPAPAASATGDTPAPPATDGNASVPVPGTRPSSAPASDCTPDAIARGLCR